jgi:nitrite reductase/ring-hydroxylating ferredoxin subunit/uncharacterized membrane protein
VPASSNSLDTGLVALLDAIERASGLDGGVGRLRSIGQRAFSSARLRSVLSGTPLGHPAHPLLVDLPIGFWTSAMLLDFSGAAQRPAARRLVGMGVLSAVPAVASGWSDWLDTDGAESRVGLVHATSNFTALGCYSMSWWKRRKGGNAGQIWAIAGATAATLGGWLGGHLAYGLGVGVDTNAFETGPEDWTVVDGPLSTDGALSCVTAGGVRLVVVANADRSKVDVLADRCSHRGGPLSEGKRRADCIVCPWHGSEFDIESGVPIRGPATASQPVYATRQTSDGIAVRRNEPRSLRRGSVRAGRRG